MGLIVEGRRQRPNTRTYNRLENVQDVMNIK